MPSRGSQRAKEPGYLAVLLVLERDFLLFWKGWSRLDSNQGEGWRGGASDSGLEEKLSMESSPGEPALPGVKRPGLSWLGLSRLGVRLMEVWWLRVRLIGVSWLGVSWLGVRLTGV